MRPLSQRKDYKCSPRGGLQHLLNFWGKYHLLDNFHQQWAADHLKPVRVKRGDILMPSVNSIGMSYFVATGLLARVEEDTETGKPKIISIAIPGMALMSTYHLYTIRAQPGKITALRSGIIVTIPHLALRQFHEHEKSIDTLIDVLSNKKKRQLVLLRQVMLLRSAFERYLSFVHLLPEIKALTTQIEQANLLGISRHTVQQAQYFLLTGRYAQK